MPSITIRSPTGPLTITEDDGAITKLEWGSVETESPTPLLERAAVQLDAYFYCELKAFDLPLAPVGSDFERAVWNLMLEIPRGAARTYGEMAAALNAAGIAAAAQPVGTACGTNPIPIIIPCHRVVGAGGGMGGYSGQGGLATKRLLLELEGWPGIAPGPLFAATPPPSSGG